MVVGALSLFDMDDFIRGAGAQRVSECASKKLREILEDDAQAIVFQAKLLARHAGRNNVTHDDIRLAAAMMR